MDITTIDGLGLETNARVMKLKKGVLCTPQLCLERGFLMTESYKETEGEPALIRRAKALEKILQEMSIYIEDGELIVGRATSKQRGGRSFLKLCGTGLSMNWILYQPGNGIKFIL